MNGSPYRLSVAVQYSAAQEVQAEALGLSVAADPRAGPRWAARGMTLGDPRGVGELAGTTATGYAFVLHGFAC